MIDRAGLAGFLRTRREALQPEDVGLPRGSRRRTSGLRREEVAALCHMSADYYARLERQRGPHPSPQMVASIAQGLHLTRAERDHLFRLAGHEPPVPGAGGDHLSPGVLRIVDRLDDTPAEVVTELGETLRQTRLGVALVGDLTRYTGPSRSIGYRWFTDPATRALYPPEDHDFYSRMYVSGLRRVLTLRGPGSRAEHLAELLAARDAEFRALWKEHEIGVLPRQVKRFLHPEVGLLELHCQTMLDPEQSHALLVYTAVPGSESHEKLRLLSVVGDLPAPTAP
ncbi:helix-turn-helix transcriptional regulator [Isoptericola sp. BMS4]|uniref:helix-turn-helix transcriptional regulator n=1 Tax=Isoptericola sp. BMS4 TaxID=2527875 RepID=UPI001422C5BC|nr:helix-turn-helix transcriptional regulator [Isoptericola sp. BMS4]